MDIATIGAQVPQDRRARCTEPRRVRGDQRLLREDEAPTSDGETQRPGCCMFKNETHNHPTEIEPFGGAATCIGGAIRDPLSGRSLCVPGHARHRRGGPARARLSETLPGKLPQRKLVTTAAAGYSSYGNQIGLATGHGERDLPSGLCGQAHGDRRGGGRGARQTNVRARDARSRAMWSCSWAGARAATACGGATGSSKAHNRELSSRPAARRCRRATRPWSASSSACSATRR